MRTYVLIGGSTGIGNALAKKLAADSHKVSIFSRYAGDFAGKSNIHHHHFDVSDKDSSLPETGEPIHGLAYLPGSITLKPFRSLKPADFQADFELNVLGAVRCIQHFLPALKEGKGSIVLFSTVAAQRGMAFHASIASAKAAVEGLGRSLAAELAPTVRVNVIAPSLTQTPLASALINSDAKIQASAERHPLKRIGQSDDIAAMAAFLLSDQASWITGQVIGVDGGLSHI